MHDSFLEGRKFISSGIFPVNLRPKRFIRREINIIPEKAGVIRITPDEYRSAQSSVWFNPNSIGDGRGNYTPEGNIAVMRGAKYDSNGPIFFSDMLITDQAMRDLASFLGFSNVNDYNSALATLGNNIFRGVASPSAIPATATYPFPIFVGTEKKQLPDNQGEFAASVPTRRPRATKDFIDFGHQFTTDFGNAFNLS